MGETVAPEHPDRCDFSWHDERLARLRGLGVKPIADLAFDGSLGRPYLEGDQPSPTGVIGWPA